MAKDTKDKSPKKTTPKEKADKPKKPLTPYNQFMQGELAKVKKGNPKLTHQEAFKIAAGNWKASAENPKNKK